MNIFTSGFELTTAITNVFILIFSIFGYIKIKNRIWKLFFLCMILDSSFGSIVHGIIMSDSIKNLLWVFLAVTFTITINTLLGIYVRLKINHIIILSIIVTFVLFSEMIFGIDFILTFSMYVLLILIICLFKIYKDGIMKNIWFILGYMFQIIGGILMLIKVDMNILNHNGIYHMFMLITLICFYIGIRRNYDNKSSSSTDRKR